MSVRTIFASPLPDPFEGFDLTQFGIRMSPCPSWCSYAPGHPDAVDTPELRHRSRARLLDPVHGGGNAHRLGRATLSVQAEQRHDRSMPPIVAIAIEINGDDQFAHLTIDEARNLRDQLTATITAIDTEISTN